MKRSFSTEPISVGSTPEKRLLLAVLIRAMSDIEGKTCLSYSERFTTPREAKRWILSDDDSPFSFKWVCGGLGINSTLVRDKCLSMATNASVMWKLRHSGLVEI